MRIRKSWSKRVPRSLEQRVRDLEKRALPDMEVADLTKDIDTKVVAIKDMATQGRDVDPIPSITDYVRAHTAEWELRTKSKHNEYLAEIGGVEAEAKALVEYRRIRWEDQRDLLDDLDAAVSHALERVTNPDTPYHEPIRRSERTGGRR
ncbi:hypothetical protein [Actinokineospora globicatena]|uniref:hypothetical protein n=1 Tax=Actinokineospora globicatena TaxID=103729 RepID=UPI0020A58C42|nr:hypothetical protein [Actinokineospora globicatena]MCP2302890.1 hypothetical protein [Actinokineospora globicatena]GLW78727.1 hypothetical protein Aglo01_32090 [Actinokineospora globicatena]GLW84605.1 hypothetical protein Aglo02_22450 [Actinokineospora globicatena]